LRPASAGVVPNQAAERVAAMRAAGRKQMINRRN
jgi:hypothetical protein